MSTPDKRPLSTMDILKRANTLGIGLFAGLLVCAGLLFVFLGVVGYDDTGIRALISLLLSPMIIAVIFGVGWMIVKGANSNPIPQSDDQDE